jgi:S-DNA-T family DNA segregation ATPase FtsK/SpoIIIE
VPNRYPPRFFLRSQAKTKRPSKKLDWMGALLVFSGILSLYCVLFPASAGVFGQNIDKFLFWLSGSGRYFIPVFAAGLGGTLLSKSVKRPRFLTLCFIAALFWSTLILFTLVGESVWFENLGGVLGAVGERLFERLFGVVGSWIVVGGFIATFGTLLAGVTPGEVFMRIKDVLVSDWKEWRSAKETAPVKKEKRTPVVEPKIQSPAAAATIAPAPIKPSAPKIVNAVEEKRKVSATAAAPKAAAEKSTEKTADKGQQKPYSSPALDIFDTKGTGFSVPKEELRARAALLEQTLANFNIAARVVEIHPGPVITRYDLEPAPGVKVSSIASRADDLALAMKSVGMRVLAPIPGKGAVGVEIPNSTAEPVGLQELLANPDFLNHKSPLAFVLGKTVSGEPYFVDLAAMPHLLIAGSTGAGKSVFAHRACRRLF